MIFVLIITRRLSPEEFGLWSLIGSVVAYFLISESIISYWSLRQIARDKEVGRTSILSSLIFSFISIPLYLVYVIVISENSDTDLSLMILGAVLIPVYFVGKIITNINLATRPQIASYGTLIFEILKIPLALATVVYFDLGIEGVIFTILIAFLIRIGIQMYFAKNKLKDKFSITILKRWFRISWVPLYSSLPKFVRTADVVIYLMITGSIIGVAYYNAALIIATLITHSAGISHSLYPKLLANGSHEYVKEIFTRLMYFAIPLLGISIIFSRPALFALNPEYQEAFLIVIILSFKTFFMVLVNAILRVLKGIEKVDVGEQPKYSKLVKSNLFSIPTSQMVQSIIYIALMVVGIIILNSSVTSDFELVKWWAIFALALEIPFFAYWWVKMKKFIVVSLPLQNIAKYVGATFVFILVYFLSSDFLIKYEVSIYDFLPGLLIQFIICVAIYLSITYLVDKKTRILFKAIIREFSPNK